MRIERAAGHRGGQAQRGRAHGARSAVRTAALNPRSLRTNRSGNLPPTYMAPSAGAEGRPQCLLSATSQHHKQIAVLDVPAGSPAMPPELHNARML